MTKYEIMLIIDPKTEIELVNKLCKDVFKEELTSFSKMERTELAYPINKQTSAIYAFVKVETDDTDKIKEFKRRVLITKHIWRELIINMDTEVGIGKKPKKFRGRMPREYKPREYKPREFKSREPISKENE